MTWEEYEVMPWRLGWKHEYFNGMAHLTPRQQSVLTIVEVASRDVPTACTIRAIVPADADELKRLFFEVFHDSLEYCDYEEADIQQSAERCIDAYFEAEQASLLGMSQGAIAPDQSLIGAALVIEQEERPPLLRLLCVAAPWQRQGIATCMVATILNGLCSTSYQQLESRYFLANEGSRNWHRKFGFQDQPDVFVTRLYFRLAQHELWRQEQLGQLSAAELAVLTAECDRLQKEVESLEAEWMNTIRCESQPAD